jgi:hypothetical protein
MKYLIFFLIALAVTSLVEMFLHGDSAARRVLRSIIIAALMTICFAYLLSWILLGLVPVIPEVL